ncbi:MAG: AAA-like domain-containing protein, partial [Cyanobacteria bacterium J06573_2]
WRVIADLSHATSPAVKTKSGGVALKPASEKKQLDSLVVDLSDSNKPTLPQPTAIPFPEGVVAPDSIFYQTRDNVESICYETVLKPASLIRIKAPKLMGKTSLIMKTIAHARSNHCHTVYLNLSSVDRNIVTDLDKFLRWLCVVVGKQLSLDSQLNNYWDTEILGSNGNCTAYFEEYLLSEINLPVVLALDEVDRIFPHTHVVEDFLGMLRSWHEKGKISRIWQNLRLILAHSTEVYIPLDLNQSPFNAGVPIELLELNTQQVQNLAVLHQLNLSDRAIIKLISILGGHPYLIRLALYHISCNLINLETLLANASKESGIYSHHLRRYLETLQKKPTLATSFKQVIDADKPVNLNPMQIYQLYSMGLVKLKDNQVIPRCNLYREYFSRVLV